jgi:rRNA maturation RNase YbeY
MPSKNPEVSLSFRDEAQTSVATLSVLNVTKRMLRRAGVRKAELSIVFLDGRRMRALNRKSLGHDYVTDVLTFDLSGGEAGAESMLCGEIYICPAEARRNARCYGEPLERELLRYIAHGILHLQGHDDSTDKQRAAMRLAEDRLLG